MDDAARREHLSEMPDYGRVVRWKSRIILDFSPDLRGSDRRLYSHVGRGFESWEVAESVRQRINADARNMPIRDAVARYRSSRSRTARATDVIDRYLEAAPTLQTRSGRFLAPRTVAHYRAVLDRSRPFLAGLTMAEACQTRTLKRWKAWFRLPPPEGRGLTSDHEARHAFAAFRAVVAWYREERPDFPRPEWPPMPGAISAKRGAGRKRERLTLPEVVRAVEAVPEPRRAVFWVMLFCGARPTEARAVLGADWDRPRLTICRSAASRSSQAEVLDSTKTGEIGTYELPEWLCDLIDRYGEPARFDPDWPLFENRDGRAKGRLYSHDALEDTWTRACKAAGVTRIPVYRAMKHTTLSALRDAGVPVEDVIDQYRFTSAAMIEHYDEAKDERRGGVVRRLDEMVSKAREE